MDTETFRQFGYQFVDWVADYLNELEEYPVRSKAKPGQIRSQLPDKAPAQGESMDMIFQDFSR